MEERSPSTISRRFDFRTRGRVPNLPRWARSSKLDTRPTRIGILLLAGALFAAGCAGRHRGPRVLAGLGALAVTAGSATWAAGEAVSNDTTSRNVVSVGFASVAIGLCAIVVAGGWMAVSVACEADPDCPEEEQCREVPAPPGGIPYKQCVPR